MSGRNDLSFIEYYAPGYRNDAEEDGTLYGAYGPRFFNMHGEYNQIQQVLERLSRKPESRRAVIQLFDAADTNAEKCEIPCTCSLQFLIRNKKLHLIANMRSNDAYMGLPHDAFAFTMLQELVARHLHLGLGEYRHFVGSLHLYERDAPRASEYLDEGWQETVAMPEMPATEPLPVIQELLKVEAQIRAGEPLNDYSQNMPRYWQDMINLLRVYRASKDGDESAVEMHARNVRSPLFEPYIFQRAERAATRADEDGSSQQSMI